MLTGPFVAADTGKNCEEEKVHAMQCVAHDQKTSRFLIPYVAARTCEIESRVIYGSALRFLTGPWLNYFGEVW